MRYRETEYNSYGREFYALQATGSFFPDYNKNGHMDITSKNGKQEPKDFIGDHRIGKPLRLQRINGSPLPITIVDIKGELKDDYWETQEEMLGGTYKRPERPYTPKKVKLSLKGVPSYDSGPTITRKYSLEEVRTELARLQLEKSVPLVVRAHSNGNGHVQEIPVFVQNA